jgi:two-component system, cell cycle sensor histidine kinase and response regulator CckA
MAPETAPTVLVIDDSEVARGLVGGALEDAGFRVTTAGSAVEGLAQIPRLSPDVIVTDLEMPETSGLDVVERAKTLAPQTPVLILSSASRVEAAVGAMRCGAFGYLVKGESDATLVEEVRAALEHHRELARRESAPRARAVPVDSAGPGPVPKASAPPDDTERDLRFQLLLAHSPDPICIVRGPRVAYANQATVAMLGLDRADQIVGRLISDLVDPSEQHRVQNGPTAASSGTLPVRIRLRDGRWCEMEVTSVPIAFEGEPSTLILMRDVTEKQRLTAQVVQMDRLAAVGALAAGVAHEINNPLAFVTSNLAFIGGEIESVLADPAGVSRLSEVREALNETIEGVARIKQIASDMKLLSRRDDPKERVDLCRVLETSVRFARPIVKPRAKLSVEIGELPDLAGSGSRLGQVFLNLLVNAAQAIPEGRSGENEVSLKARQVGGAVVVEVRDTGSGMSPQVKARLFEPFFTTKPTGVGTGLGLSISQRIVHDHGGTISVQSESGSGSVFRVELPVVQLADRGDEPRPSQPASPLEQGAVGITRPAA